MDQLQMFETTEEKTATPSFLVLISSSRGVYRSFLDTDDREEAIATGHFIAVEHLGLESDEYDISVAKATRYNKA